MNSPKESHAAWPSFLKLRGAAPGDLDLAWRMFRSGWEALEAKLEAQATDWWCDHG